VLLIIGQVTTGAFGRRCCHFTQSNCHSFVWPAWSSTAPVPVRPDGPESRIWTVHFPSCSPVTRNFPFASGATVVEMMSARHAAPWETKVTVNLEIQDRHLAEPSERLLDDLALRPDDKVVELGCGPGGFTRRILARLGPGGVVVGVDSGVDILKHAQARWPGTDRPGFSLSWPTSLNSARGSQEDT
jgi:hypothetical protein